MRHIKGWIGAVGVVLVTTTAGCYRMDLEVAKVYGEPSPGAQALGTFRTERKCHALVFGIFSLGSPNVKEAIEEEVRNQGGRLARNVKVHHSRSFIDGFLGGLTWGIYSPTTVEIEGEVIK